MKTPSRTFMSHPGASRRRILRGATTAGALAALRPLLPFGLTTTAAAAGKRPTNLVLVFHPNGLELGWQPLGGETDYQLPPVMQALEPHRSRLMVVNGLIGGIRNEVQGHAQGMTSMWTGAQIPADGDLANHQSFDQSAAARLGLGTPFRSLELGVQTQPTGAIDNLNVMIYEGPGKPLPAEDDPNRVYDRLFGAAGVDPASLARRKREGRSVLDFVKGQLQTIRGAYGRSDQALIDAHVESVRRFEKRLDGLGALSCNHEYTAHGRKDIVRNTAHFQEAAELQADLLTLAMGCGLTRVASLQYASSASDARIPGVNDEVALHTTMHTRPREEKVRINRYFVEQLAALIARFDAQENPDGSTLLDDTIIVWGTEMAVGNHLNGPVPFVVAGGGSAFKLGHAFTFTDEPRHTRLLVTALAALGIEDVDTLGDLRGENDVGQLERLRG